MFRERIDWHKVWQLIKPYWVSEEKWRARSLLATVVVLALGMVYVNVLINDWNRDFYNALEQKDYDAFVRHLWRFTWLAFIYIAVAIYRIYLTQALQMRWRAWMTRQYMGMWLANQAYYRIEQQRSTDNPDQRIAEDLEQLTAGSLSLGLGLLSSVVTLVSFVGILWQISGPFTFMLSNAQITIPGYMVWAAILYAGAGSLLVWWIGKPLVAQNFNQQRYEANFRFGLVRIRENAEAVALYGGEAQEQADLSRRFEAIRRNWWAIMRTTKRLNVASTFYAQLALIFPLLASAPRYFAGAISFGQVMQTVSAFGQVQEALSWFINAFDSLAGWKAGVNRLAGFHAAVDLACTQTPGLIVERNNVGAILLERVALHSPSGTVLTEPFSAQVHHGQRVLVSGPSGCGKSTLFRALAGIWPYGEGSIEIPSAARVLFVPQKAYLPIGTLRAAIAYPAAENAYKDLALRHYLELCRLPQLVNQLDAEDNWSQRLSPGEQQRLAFVRVLLARPDVLCLDEATSALDPETEEALYALLLEELPDIILISVAHREALARHHQIRWQFVQCDEGTAPVRYTIRPSRISNKNDTRSRA